MKAGVLVECKSTGEIALVIETYNLPSHDYPAVDGWFIGLWPGGVIAATIFNNVNIIFVQNDYR